jgi:WD40 repeat protein
MNINLPTNFNIFFINCLINTSLISNNYVLAVTHQIIPKLENILSPIGISQLISVNASPAEAVARQITVRIDGKNRGGSGVIVEKQGEIYYVLTNWHVVEAIGDYQIITPDGVSHEVYYSLIERLPGLDLAIIPFHSQNNYPIAQINSTVMNRDETVYVAGWPRSGSNFRQRTFFVSQGVITQRIAGRNDYNLLYDNLVRTGMSGGPILNQAGQLVGINGLVKLAADQENIVSGGLEIQNFLTWRAGRTLAKIPIPPKSPNTVTPPVNPANSNNNNNINTSNSTQDWQLISTIAGPPGIVSDLDMLGNYIINSNSNGQIVFSDLSQGKLLEKLSVSESAINSLVVVPQENLLITAGDEPTIKIWQIGNLEQVPTLTLKNTLIGHTDTISALAMSSDRQLLVSGSWDKTVRIWRISTGELLKTLVGHDILISAIAITTDGKTIISGSKDGVIKFWDVGTGKNWQTLTSQSLGVLSLAVSQDNQVLVSGHANGQVNIWSITNGQLLRNLSAHRDGVWAIQFSADQQTVMTGSWDKTIKLWDAQTGQLTNTLLQDDYVNSLIITTDGKQMISGDWQGKIHIWQK